MKEEYQSFVKSSSDTHSRLNMRLQHCYGKMNIISKEKNLELTANKSEYENLDSKVKNYEDVIEKNKIELKKSRESNLVKGNKLTENLDLIEDKIKSIIDNLPNLNGENNSRIKKQISQARNNLLHIERKLNKNKIPMQRNIEINNNNEESKNKK